MSKEPQGKCCPDCTKHCYKVGCPNKFSLVNVKCLGPCAHDCHTPPEPQECADCGKRLDGQNCSAGGVHDLVAQPSEEWEEEFDHKWNTANAWLVVKFINGNCANQVHQVKDFIRETVAKAKEQEREAVIKMLEELAKCEEVECNKTHTIQAAINRIKGENK